MAKRQRRERRKPTLREFICEGCRKSRKRCDREQPQCGNCAKARRPCIVNEDERLTGRKKKGQMKELTARIEVLEAILRPRVLGSRTTLLMPDERLTTGGEEEEQREDVENSYKQQGSSKEMAITAKPVGRERQQPGYVGGQKDQLDSRNFSSRFPWPHTTTANTSVNETISINAHQPLPNQPVINFTSWIPDSHHTLGQVGSVASTDPNPGFHYNNTLYRVSALRFEGGRSITS